MTWTTEYFGNELKTKSGKASTEETLANKKVIAIYFSAHWVSCIFNNHIDTRSSYADLKHSAHLAVDLLQS